MTERERMEFFERQGEEAYSSMYDATSSSAATARYSDAKEAFCSAIGLARQLKDAASAERLETRLAAIKSVFRSQFS